MLDIDLLMIAAAVAAVGVGAVGVGAPLESAVLTLFSIPTTLEERPCGRARRARGGFSCASRPTYAVDPRYIR